VEGLLAPETVKQIYLHGHKQPAPISPDNFFFTREGGEAYLRDLPRAEMHRLDSGRFAVEDSADTIAEAMIAFHAREVA
jgi:hypothetical protein